MYRFRIIQQLASLKEAIEYKTARGVFVIREESDYWILTATSSSNKIKKFCMMLSGGTVNEMPRLFS